MFAALAPPPDPNRDEIPVTWHEALPEIVRIHYRPAAIPIKIYLMKSKRGLPQKRDQQLAPVRKLQNKFDLTIAEGEV